MGADGPYTCTECDRPVNRPGAACSATCRSRRKRRRDAEAASGREVTKLVTDEAERAASELLRENLKPVVKEAITEDLVSRIHEMIGAMPEAIEALIEDINPEPDGPDGELTDDQLDRRQRAYTQLFKLTAANKNLVPDINADKQRDLTVIFGGALARSEIAKERLGEEVSGVIESKTCDACGVAKSLEDFVGTSDRCQQCFDEMREAAVGIVGDRALDHTDG